MKSNTIAVLPFLNISPDKEHEYFSDGITEEIINALAQISGLKVISRTSSFYFKNKNIPLKDIAIQLNAEIILEGSVRVAGKMMRITAQLIQAEEDFHFWSETWDRKLENVFEIQDEISLLIAEKLREQSGHFEIRDHLVAKQTENLDAYEYSLKANYHFNKWNPQDVREAIRLYDKAIELDPKHTESYVGLADAYSFLATTEFMSREEGWQKTVEYTQKAYALDPKNAGVHYQLANLSFFTDCNFSEATRHAIRAVELKPSYPEAQQYMAFLYMLTGQWDQARQHLQFALGIDPLNPETLFYKAYYEYKTGNYRGALDQYNEILLKNPKNIPSNVVRSYCLLKLGSYDEVLKTMKNMPKEIVMPDEQLGITCLAYIMKGDESQTKKHLDLLMEEAQKPMAFQAHSYLFLAYANLSMHDEAFEWVENSLKKKSSIFLLSFSDPLVSALKEDLR
ncbi:MAG: tetratricopeptide repeat protein, partial [Bacteroidales bacterium]